MSSSSSVTSRSVGWIVFPMSATAFTVNLFSRYIIIGIIIHVYLDSSSLFSRDFISIIA